MITFSIDTSRAQQQLEALHDAMVGKGMDASSVVRDELRFLSRTIVNFTPPLGPGGRVAGAKKAGENAISRELDNLISQGKPKFLTEVAQKWGLKDVKGFVTRPDGSKLAIQFNDVDPSGERLKELHLRYRSTERGKVPLQRHRDGTWSARVLTVQGQRAPYISRVQSRVGRWKATWAYAAGLAGSKFPQWISRHFPTLGNLTVADIHGLDDPVYPVVTFGSRAPGGRRTVQRIQAAVNFRAQAMRRRIKLILSGYRADVARKIRAEAQAHKHRESEPNIE
jgi:hypothetical protein